MSRKGQISVQTSDIFPIIKKWLYSEHDIFLRELISNATDAITKRSMISRTEGQEMPEGNILVSFNKTEKIIKITDNGVGMTEEEVEKYIAQLAFSGAEDFIKNMKDETEKDGKSDIIGKFGLGFYSAFMVADKVEINSLSMKEGAKATNWTCEGETDYTFNDSERKEVGTEIILYVNEDNEEFLNQYKLDSTLKRFGSFLPFTIGLLDEEKEPEYPKNEDGTDDTTKPLIAVTPSVINDTEPLWKKNPNDLKDEDYQNFFKKLFPMDPTPLFWIHLKVDHPFTLEGILYFPKVDPHKPVKESNIHLYNKQVFVSDNVKDIIPEFLGLLKGVIDSSDIPLNVSRSSLQGDPNIKRISNYIIKKVAESLKKLFKNEREKYEGIWEDTGVFIKYGIVSDTKFDELMRPMAIFQNTKKEYKTLSEYKESIPEEYREKLKDSVVYFEKDKTDWSLKDQLVGAGVDALEMDEHIDPHFMQHVEIHKKGDEETKFTCMDNVVSSLFEDESSTPEDIKVKDLFDKYLVGTKDEPKEDKDNGNPLAQMGGYEIEIGKSSHSNSCAYLKVDEQMKRFAKMAQSMGQNNSFPVKKTLVVNPNNQLVKNALKIHEKGDHNELVERLCHHVEDLAKISSDGLDNDQKEVFVKRSQEILQELTQLAL
jgi:molecular chaperone HtpG